MSTSRTRRKRKKYPGQDDVILNPNLLNRQGISKRRAERIQQSHVVMRRIKDKMSQTDDVPRLRSLARRVERMEFIQQKLWGFELDPSKHYWYRVPKCTCPKMDNAEAWGVPNHRIVVSDCPIHWTEEHESRLKNRS